MLWNTFEVFFVQGIRHSRDKHTHTCVIDFVSAVGAHRCWGYGNYGQLGQGDTVSYGSTAWPVGGLPSVNLGTVPATGAARKAVKAAAGTEFTCVLTDDSQVFLVFSRVPCASLCCSRGL